MQPAEKADPLPQSLAGTTLEVSSLRDLAATLFACRRLYFDYAQ
jgi:hypothetical protein